MNTHNNPQIVIESSRASHRELYYRPTQHHFGLYRTGVEKKDFVTAAILVFLLFNPFLLASARPSTHTDKVFLEGAHTRSVSAGWRDAGNADANGYQHIVFAVKQENMEQLKAYLLEESSNPFSPKYGQHMTFEQVNNLVRPLSSRLDAVRSWIQAAFGDAIEQGSLAETAANDFIVANIKRSQLESVLGVSFRVFTHDDAETTIIRSVLPYSVPSSIGAHLDFIGGIHRFPDVKRILKEKAFLREKKAASAAASSSSFGSVFESLGASPTSLRKLYNVTDLTGSTSTNSQSVAAFLEQYYYNSDYNEFNRLYNPDNIGFPIAKVIGKNGNPAGVEASLDVEYITSVAANYVPTWFWSVSGREGTQEPFLEWTLEISNTTDAPWVHSVSYGDDENSLDAAYMNRVSDEFAKIGARGISILIASGDSGVGGSGSSCKVFVPNFPVSSPYVTAVGGTTLPVLGGGEQTASLSGGGFSNIFTRPSYQDAAVSHYLSTATGLPAPSYYNASGRAYPDIAAMAEGFIVVANFVPLPGVAGTSCATPTASSIVTRLNDARFLAGKTSLGFLNPLIYGKLSESGNALYDVVKGCNPGCGLNGFCATTGWDGSSGFGTINYGNSKSVVLDLP